MDDESVFKTKLQITANYGYSSEIPPTDPSLRLATLHYCCYDCQALHSHTADAVYNENRADLLLEMFSNFRKNGSLMSAEADKSGLLISSSMSWVKKYH